MTTATTLKATQRAAQRSLLELGELPIEELAQLAAREGKRPRPIYGAHKWFARRAGSSFRALLVSSQVHDPGQFWANYYGEADLSGKTVLDPFVGGGTSVVEAARLGANAVGADIDSIACAITGFELASTEKPDPTAVGEQLKRSIAPELANYYETTLSTGEVRDVLHFFWVQVVECAECGNETHAHPHFRLAYQAEGNRQWVFCRTCGEIHEFPKWFKSFSCKQCGTKTVISEGPESGGKVRCESCSSEERLIDNAKRTGSVPRWHLFAIESIPKTRPGAGRVNMVHRHFSSATDVDRQKFVSASEHLATADQTWLASIDDDIGKLGRSDDRLVKYGYEKYRQLFNSRQLLHLSLLLDAISDLPDADRQAASIAFSDHLTKNCMLTCYAFGWRRLVPLFAFRAFRHITRPVEINPWLLGVGRGTYPNAIKQSSRAIHAAKHPTELLRDGGELPVPPRVGGNPMVVNAIAQDLPLGDSSVDLVMTDPPYFDNIDYSELADFYRPWMRLLGLIDSDSSHKPEKSLASKSRGTDSAATFSIQLEEVAKELDRVLKNDGLVAFTFRHNLKRGWQALADGLVSSSRFKCVQVFPMLAEGANALHTKEHSGVFDAVFVLTKGEPACAFEEVVDSRLSCAGDHAELWATRLETAELPLPFRRQDRTNFTHACTVAAALGLFD